MDLCSYLVNVRSARLTTELNDCMHMIGDPNPGSQAEFSLLHRRSYVGLYVRRASFQFAMMLEHERMQLLQLCRAWRDGDAHAVVDRWRTSAQAHAYYMWRESARRGEYVILKENLHAFFNYTLPGCDRDLHQHALLNLAHFHTQTQGYQAARTVLDEAILLARTVGDTECIRACDHLLDQLSYLDPRPHQAGLLTQQDAQESLQCGAYAPLALWKADMDRQQGRPLLDIIQRIYDTTWKPRPPIPTTQPEWEPRPSIERCAACPSAILARTWLQLGVPLVAEVYMAHVRRLGSFRPEHWDELVVDTAITKAFRETERGMYDQGVSALLEPSVLRQVTSLALHQRWQDAVWQILYTRARRQSHTSMLRRIKALSPHVGEWYTPLPSPTQRSACDWLEEAQNMIQARQPHQGLEALMRALAASEAQQLYPLRRTCLAVLADVMVLSLGMPSEARALLDEILPQALADENGERRAYVHLVEAKYFISTKDLYQARMSLRRAALDYERTETWKDLASCLYMEARVAHALHDADHDDVQARYERAQAQYDAALVAPCPSTLDAWVQLVRRLGAFSRRRDT